MDEKPELHEENDTAAAESEPFPLPPSVPVSATLSERAPAPVSPELPLLRRVFVGPDGLRAGWRLLIYIALTVAIAFGLGRLLLHGRHAFGPLIVTLGEAVLLVAVTVPAVILSYYERRSWNSYGLPLRKMLGARFWEGAVWGFVALSVLLLAIAATGSFSFGQFALHGRAIAYYAASWGVAFLLVGLAEEFALRGYTQFTLASGIGFWPAALVLSAAFAALHMGNKGENPVGILNVFVVGMFFCLTLRRTGNLWFAVGFHAAWDWAESFFYGVPDSGAVMPGHLLSPVFHGSRWLTGGDAGPEGSVLCLVLIGVLSLLVAVRFPRQVNYPDPRTIAETLQEG